MPKYVITHHAHHPDENVYKLIYAEEIESNGNKGYINHKDIIWADWDKRWENRTNEDIADEQINILKGIFNKRMEEIKRLEAEEKEKQIAHFEGSVGQQL